MYRCVCLAAAVMCVTTTVYAQDQSSSVIVVRGEAVSRAPADIVIWEVKLRREAADRAGARTALEAETTRLAEAAATAGLNSQDVALSPIRIVPIETGSNNDATRFAASRTMKMTQRNLSGALAFCNILTAAHPEALAYYLEHSKRALLEHETQLQAVENAKRQASSIAETLSVPLGNVIGVENELGVGGAFGLKPHFSTYLARPIEHIHDPAAFVDSPIEIRALIYVTYTIG